MISLLILLLSHTASADSIEFLGGAMTYHLIGDASQSYTNKITPDGRLISNPMAGFQYNKETDLSYESITIFTGSDSVGGLMTGMKWSEGLKVGNFYIGPTVGGYVQNQSNFDNANIQPFRLTEVDGIDIVPVIGIELDYKIVLTKDIYVKINNVISPILTNTSLGLGFSF